MPPNNLIPNHNEVLATTAPSAERNTHIELPHESEKMLPDASTADKDVELNQKLKSKKIIYLRIFVIQWAFLLGTSIFIYFYIGDFIQGLVNKGLAISPESDYFYLWEEPPIQPEMSIYLFNVTNSEEWLRGEHKRISVQQLGPYVYRESWKKTNISFNSDGTIATYRLMKKFQFLPEKSSSEEDVVVVPNIPLFGAATAMKNADSFTLMGFKAFLNMMAEESKQIFLKKSVRELIWGYDDELSSMASMMIPPEEGLVPGKFGLLVGKNESLSPWQSINTGIKNIRQISQTLEYMGKTEFKSWSTPQCNKIHGSDGSFFSPWIHSSDVLEIFVPDICSTIRLTSTGEEVLLDNGRISTFRFRPHPHMFNYDHEENLCFCSAGNSETNENDLEIDDSWSDWFSESSVEDINTTPETTNKVSCPPNGVMNLGPCKFGAPLFVSWPLFFNSGNRSLITSVEGLPEANEADHGFRMDIQPTMGIGLSAHVRLQMNLQIENSPVLPGLPRIDSSFLLPIMWFDDAIDTVPEELTEMLREALTSGPGIALKIFLSVIAFLVIELFILICYLVWRYSSTKISKDGSSWWKDLLDDISILRKSI